jgi:hypothetical protein
MNDKKIAENKAKGGEGNSEGVMNNVEKSHVLLYRLKLYEENNRWQELVDSVAKNKRDILDKLEQHSYLVKAHIALENWKEARDSVDTLLLYIPENEQHIVRYAELGEKLGISK